MTCQIRLVIKIKYCTINHLYLFVKTNVPVKKQEIEQFISVEFHALQERQFYSGVQFVAKKNGRDEDDGWVITYVHDEGANISQVI